MIMSGILDLYRLEMTALPERVFSAQRLRILGCKSPPYKQVAATSMVKREDITGVAMSLKVDEQLSSFALLAADGSINRLGTGTIENTEKEMFIGGISDPKLFQNLRAQISPELFTWIGGRADPNPKGTVCELTSWLFLSSKEQRGIYSKYGSQSLGPPPEVSRLVIATVELTDPWYEEFKAGVGNQRK
jgi:hypothetical protein